MILCPHIWSDADNDDHRCQYESHHRGLCRCCCGEQEPTDA